MTKRYAVKCALCNGKGLICFTLASKKKSGFPYYKYIDCPVCDGFGFLKVEEVER